MRLIQRVQKNFDDIAAFGPGFLGRHVDRLRGRDTMAVPVPEVGSVHLRMGKSDLDTLRQIFVARQYDLGERSPATARLQARYREIVAGGGVPVIVDAGANIGAAALWFRARYPEAHIVAVEPEDGNFAMLARNLDGRPRFTPLKAAIGAREGHVAIEAGTSGSAARTSHADSGIPMVTVPQAMAMVPNGVPFIVKVDIEGFEADLFSENVDWVRDVYQVTVEPHDWMLSGRHTSRNFQRVMGQHEFEVFLAGDNLIYVRV